MPKTKTEFDLDYLPYAVAESLITRVHKKLLGDIQSEFNKDFRVGSVVSVVGNKFEFEIVDNFGKSHLIRVTVSRPRKRL